METSLLKLSLGFSRYPLESEVSSRSHKLTRVQALPQGVDEKGSHKENGQHNTARAERIKTYANFSHWVFLAKLETPIECTG
jgi:hypothetical protein